eukprot:scaffold25126_cov21-Prasinocladus_malaysianus.AAC.2
MSWASKCNNTSCQLMGENLPVARAATAAGKCCSLSHHDEQAEFYPLLAASVGSPAKGPWWLAQSRTADWHIALSCHGCWQERLICF